MKPIAAIVESVVAPSLAAVRAAASALREATAQEERAENRLGDARAVAARRRLELGRALVEARKAWPASGPKARGWGEFLEREGITSQRASEFMRLAGYVATDSPGMDIDAGEIPTLADAGIDRRRRLAEEQPDPPRFGARADLGRDGTAANANQAAAVGVDLRLGDWRSVLANIGMVDAVICDPPYGARTHAASTTRSDSSAAAGLTPDYGAWMPADVAAFVSAWAPRCRGWMVALTDHSLIDAWTEAYRATGRYAFAPVPCVITGMSVRIQGDGPSSWTVYAMVSRPPALASWGTLRGAYVGPRVAGAEHGRGKPPWLLDALVSDYTRAGDLVCDPLAGYATTLIAAHAADRRAVGAEIDQVAHAEGLARIAVASARSSWRADADGHVRFRGQGVRGRQSIEATERFELGQARDELAAASDMLSAADAIEDRRDREEAQKAARARIVLGKRFLDELLERYE